MSMRAWGAGVLSLLLGLAALPLGARVLSFEAQVSHVSDGDTIWVRPVHGGGAQPVRLAGIDAPELCQTGGRAAREALARAVLGQRVRVTTSAQDDYGRALARVRWRGRDLGRWLVRGGHAWSYRFRGDPGPYAAEERLARQARRGLWRDRDPLEPRLFRQRHGPCGSAPGHGGGAVPMRTQLLEEALAGR